MLEQRKLGAGVQIELEDLLGVLGCEAFDINHTQTTIQKRDVNTSVQERLDDGR